MKPMVRDLGAAHEAHEICTGRWNLTAAEAEALVAGDCDRAVAVIRIARLLAELYSGPLPAMWMTVPNRNPAIGGTEATPVRPVGHALRNEAGLWDVLRLLEGTGDRTPPPETGISFSARLDGHPEHTHPPMSESVEK